MPYLIDGYNFIHCDSRLENVLEKNTLESCRTALITILASFRRTTNEEIIVVFDGGKSGAIYPRVQNKNGIKLIYSDPDSDADTAIEEFLEAAQGQKGFVVVSSDKKVRRVGRHFGAGVMSSNEFRLLVDQKLRPKRNRRSKEKLPKEKLEGIDKHQAKFWLEIFGIEEE